MCPVQSQNSKSCEDRCTFSSPLTEVGQCNFLCLARFLGEMVIDMLLFFIRLEMEFWDTLAHVAGQHLKKGDQIYVTGYLKVDVYLKDEVQQKITRVRPL